MEEKLADTIEKAKKQAARSTVSTVLPDGSLVEMVCQENRTLFCVAKDGEFHYVTNLLVNGQRLVPYSPRNNLLTNEVVLLPSAPPAPCSAGWSWTRRLPLLGRKGRTRQDLE